ncbi:hypothetical protein BDV96DRAFT_86960 [Lophiotrema nucula]|uniref:Alcohol dehydrogenase n=1 Tax=Lophiotrema nucula TaxID=690887 RepID=A0A6A5Z5X0_9PLEO|nr:hypothetical protein BDV96DRAFT_86960 [Lophiotrema nucula]
MALNATMRGVVYNSPYNMTVENLPMPTIINQTDAIVRITTSALCGSDLHTYHGISGEGPIPMGHEAVGYVSELGSAVTQLALGDYVVIPDNVRPGHYSDLPPPMDSFGGGTGLGGLQAEYVRVPIANENLVLIPVTSNTTNSTIEQDYLTLSDIFATGWTAVTWSGFESGDTVAVFGAGPVGLLATYSAILRGASRVYTVDRIPQRLELAESLGAIPISFNESDPVQQILAYEPNGVRRSVDCVGSEAVNAAGEVDSGIVLQHMIGATMPYGGIGQIGVYMTPEPVPGSNVSPNVSLPITNFFTNALSYRAGVVQPLDVAPELTALIQSGKAKPSFIRTAEIGIEEAPEYYRRFDQHEEVKVYIRFP